MPRFTQAHHRVYIRDMVNPDLSIGSIVRVQAEILLKRAMIVTKQIITYAGAGFGRSPIGTLSENDVCIIVSLLTTTDDNVVHSYILSSTAVGWRSTAWIKPVL